MTRDEQAKAWAEILRLKIYLGECSVSEMFRSLTPQEAEERRRAKERVAHLERQLKGDT